MGVGTSTRARLRRAALPLAVLVVLLAGAELVVRAFFPQPAFFARPGIYVADARTGYRMRGGVDGVVGNVAEFENRFHLDAAGLRGPEVGAHRPGVLRVLVLGDSLTFGPGVDDDQTYPALLGRELAAHGIAAEGLDAGVGGYGVPDEVAWHAAYGLPLQPDVVVLGVFTGNDLQDADPAKPPLAVEDGELLDASDRRRSKPFHWLFQRSQLVALAKYSLPEGVDRRLRRLLDLPEPGAVRALRGEMATYARTPDAATLAGARASEAAIRRLVALDREHGIATVALLLPSYLQADRRAWDDAVRALALDPRAYDAAVPGRLFAAALARAGVPTLDLGPPFAQGVARGERLFYPHDHHYTAAGHRLIAHELAAFLPARLHGATA